MAHLALPPNFFELASAAGKAQMAHMARNRMVVAKSIVSILVAGYLAACGLAWLHSMPVVGEFCLTFTMVSHKRSRFKTSTDWYFLAVLLFEPAQYSFAHCAWSRQGTPSRTAQNGSYRGSKQAGEGEQCHNLEGIKLFELVICMGIRR